MLWMMLLALQAKTVGRNFMIVAASYMKRLGMCLSIGFESWFKPAASAPPIQQEIYARPWEPIDLHVDDVTVLLALQERLLGDMA